MNLADDLVRLVVGLFTGILLSYPMPLMDSNIRKAYSLVIGTVLQIYVYRDHIVLIYLQMLVTFAITKIVPNKCGPIVLLESMVLLSSYHIHELITNYGGWSMGATGLAMINVCKASMLAFAVQDNTKDVTSLSAEQKLLKIAQPPSLFYYVSYFNFLPCAAIGPPIEFTLFRDYINNSQRYATLGFTPIKVILKTILESAICVGVYVLGDIFFPVSSMKTLEFVTNPVWYIALFVWASIFLVRFKYYFGWKLSVAAVQASGLGFDGHSYDLISNCNVINVETSMHLREKISNWNCCVQEWLRKCIYLRSPFKNRSLSQLSVFIVSAFWHGFYPAYYFSFFFWFAQLDFQAQLFKIVSSSGIQDRFNKLRPAIYHPLCFIMSSLVHCFFSLNGCFFIVLDFQYSYNMMKRLYFLPQIAVLVALAISKLFKPKKARQASNETGKSIGTNDNKSVADNKSTAVKVD